MKHIIIENVMCVRVDTRGVPAELSSEILDLRIYNCYCGTEIKFEDRALLIAPADVREAVTASNASVLDEVCPDCLGAMPINSDD